VLTHILNNSVATLLNFLFWVYKMIIMK
jgi:hypothetical protein